MNLSMCLFELVTKEHLWLKMLSEHVRIKDSLAEIEKKNLKLIITKFAWMEGKYTLHESTSPEESVRCLKHILQCLPKMLWAL